MHQLVAAVWEQPERPTQKKIPFRFRVHYAANKEYDTVCALINKLENIDFEEAHD